MPKKTTSELAEKVHQERKDYFKYAFNNYLQNLRKKRLETILTFGEKASIIDSTITKADLDYYGLSGGDIKLRKKDYAEAFKQARAILNSRGKTKTETALQHFSHYVPKFPSDKDDYNKLASAVKKLAKEPFKKPRTWKLEPNERKRYFTLKKSFPEVQRKVRALLKASRSKTQTRPPRDLIYQALNDLYSAHPSRVKIKLVVPLIEKDPQKTEQIISKINQPHYIISKETRKELKFADQLKKETTRIIQSSNLNEKDKEDLMDKLVRTPKTSLIPLTKRDPYNYKNLQEKYGGAWYAWRNTPHLWGKDYHEAHKTQQKLSKKAKVGKYTFPFDILEEWKYQSHKKGEEFHYQEPEHIYEIPFSGEANFLRIEERRFQAWNKIYHPNKKLNFKENWAEYLLERKNILRLEKELKGFFKKGRFPANVPKWINEVEWTTCEACFGSGCQEIEVEDSQMTCLICFNWNQIIWDLGSDIEYFKIRIGETGMGTHPFLTSHNCQWKNTAKNVHEQARSLQVPWLGSLGLCGERYPRSFSVRYYQMSHLFVSLGGGGCHLLWKMFERKTHRKRI